MELDDVRRRIKARLGVDPYEYSLVSKRDRYLQRTCGHLPPIGSAEREKIRNGFSLDEIIQQLKKQTERDENDIEEGEMI